MISSKILNKSENKKSDKFYAVSNIHWEGFLSALDVGALVCPSIALVNGDTDYSDFGKISVVFKSSVLFDGKESCQINDRISYVYSRDAYTARFPEQYLKLPKRSFREFLEKVSNNKHNLNTSNSVDRWGERGYVNSHSVKSDMIRDLAIKLSFLSEQGVEFTTPYKKVRMSCGLSNEPALSKFLSSDKGSKIISDASNYFDSELVKLVASKLKEALDSMCKRQPEFESDFRDIFSDYIFDDLTDRRAIAPVLQSLIIDSSRLRSGKDKVIDEALLRQRVDKRINSDEFELWVHNEINKISEGQYVKRSNKYIESTANNISSIMRKDKGASVEETSSFSLGEGLSKQSFRLYSIEDIKEYFDNESEAMTLRSTDTREAADRALFNVIFSLKTCLMEANPNKYSDNEAERLIGFAMAENDFSSLKKYLLGKGVEDSAFNDSLIRDIEVVKDYYSEFKPKYLEAKPMRPVSFNKIDFSEISHICVPRAMKPTFVNALEQYGFPVENMNIVTYNPNQEGSRKNAQTRRAGVTFRKKSLDKSLSNNLSENPTVSKSAPKLS